MYSGLETMMSHNNIAEHRIDGLHNIRAAVGKSADFIVRNTSMLIV
jgi:hypothetical protein